MVDVVSLQDRIIERPERIITILHALGYDNIKDKQKYYSFPHKDGDNPSAISILKSTLQYNDYSRGGSGNIFTLIRKEKPWLTFRQMLEWVASILGLDEYDVGAYNVTLPFGGFYKTIAAQGKNAELYMKTYSEKDLPAADSLSYKWFLDGVSYVTQEKFGIRYDHVSNHIIIPERNILGDIVGAKARSNDPKCPMDKRWYAYIGFQKTLCLYGFCENYSNIVTKRKVIIVESEKAVLQAYDVGCYICLAVGGHTISDTQARLIKSLMCDEIIVAFDQDLVEEEIVYEAKKLVVDNRMFKNKVYYTYDGDGKYLPKGSKMSPTDAGANVFKKVLSGCRKEIN